jgi:acyl-CoA thioesterase I
MRSAAIFLLCTAAFLSPPSAGGAQDNSNLKQILVFGDSLSEGFLLKHDQAWPMLLAEKLRADGLDYEIVNASQSGGTTATGLARLGPHLNGRIDIFVLELGINDVFHGISFSEIRDNLQEIIDRVKQASPGVRLVICGFKLPNHSGDDYGNRFEQIYVDLAEKNRAALVRSFLENVHGNDSLNLFDHIHPNAAGHRVLADNVWRVLEPIAREVAPQY